MAKKKHVDAPVAPEVAQTEDAPAAAAGKRGPIGARGPKGVALDALIFLQVKDNPKRPGSKAHAVFSQYVDGMTVQQFLDAVGNAATPNLVYDAAHDFIKIEGYNPESVAKKERAPKAAGEKKPRKSKIASDPVNTEVEDALAAETQDELID